jgi:hypothetical protein
VGRVVADTKDRNDSCRAPTANRYSKLMHDISFSIATLSNRSTYDFLRLNLLPLPRRAYTMQKRLRAVVGINTPGLTVARFDAARDFYANIGYKGVYTTSSDATALRPIVTVQPRTQRLLGIVSLLNVVADETVQGMMKDITAHGIARQADVLSLNPLDTLYPSFVLAVFPQNATPKHEVLLERWGIVRLLLDQRELPILGHGCDGDAAQLKAQLAQKITTSTSPGSVFSFTGVPTITGGVMDVSCAARRCNLPGLYQLTVPLLATQDPTHLLLKLRARIVNRAGIGVYMGSQGRASVLVLKYIVAGLLSLRTEIGLGFRLSDLDAKDRMNFPAAERIFSEAVIHMLEQRPTLTVPCAPLAPSPPPTAAPVAAPVAPVAAAPVAAPAASAAPRAAARRSKKRTTSPPPPPAPTPRGSKKRAAPPPPAPLPARAQETAAYLRLGRDAVFAFLARDVGAEERLKQAWTARYFADGWRAFLVENKMPLGRDFLSSNQYSCIVLNAESLLLFYHWLCSDPELRAKVPASAFGFGSQQCENIFRGLRGQHNDPNFVLEEMFRRLVVCQEMELIKQEHAHLLKFAAHHKHTRNDHIRRPAEWLPASYSETRARAILAEALNVAKQRLAALGMQLKGATPSPRMYVVTTRSSLSPSAYWFC